MHRVPRWVLTLGVALWLGSLGFLLARNRPSTWDAPSVPEPTPLPRASHAYPTGSAILDRMEKRYGRINTYECEAVVRDNYWGQGRFHLWFRRPNLFRLEWRERPGLPGQGDTRYLGLCRGLEAQAYYRSRGSGSLGWLRALSRSDHSGALSTASMLPLAPRSLLGDHNSQAIFGMTCVSDAELVGEESVEGTRCYHVRAREGCATTGSGGYDFWVGVRDSLLYRWGWTSHEGLRQGGTDDDAGLEAYHALRVDPPLPDSLFAQPPAGYVRVKDPRTQGQR